MAGVLIRGSFPLTLFFRLFCALEGKYLVQEATHELMDSVDTFKEHDEQCINFNCSIPVANGRGFIEVLFSYNACHVSCLIHVECIPKYCYFIQCFLVCICVCAKVCQVGVWFGFHLSLLVLNFILASFLTYLFLFVKEKDIMLSV